ncbi:hypothetical protein ACUM5Y_05780 [Marinomonas dokdonensis]|uniref:hypothetical protein n=1 Tax=Marinomonas dokdonensis TaxID=328224 RepID=UPI0040554ABD
MQKYYLILMCAMGLSNAAWAEKEPVNFELGLGYGLLERKSLLNIDAKINMPLGEHSSTQVYLNSNYLITGSDKDTYALSEFASNWFLFNDYGRVGAGLGVTELAPKDTSQESEREVTGRVMLDAFLEDFSFTGQYVSADKSLSNLTSSRLGLSYYIDDTRRISIYKERFDEKVVWRAEHYFQPDSLEQLASVGLIARRGNGLSYFGIAIEYYFDQAFTLKGRDRAYH